MRFDHTYCGKPTWYADSGQHMWHHAIKTQHSHMPRRCLSLPTRIRNTKGIKSNVMCTVHRWPVMNGYDMYIYRIRISYTIIHNIHIYDHIWLYMHDSTCNVLQWLGDQSGRKGDWFVAYFCLCYHLILLDSISKSFQIDLTILKPSFPFESPIFCLWKF